MTRPDLYWVQGIEGVRLAIMPRPRAGEWLPDEVAGWREMGIGTVVSLLDAEEARELGLDEEGSRCQAAGVRFVSFPIPDRGLPASEPSFREEVKSLAASLRVGEAVAIHCRAGIGRSGVLGACILGELGVDADMALAMLSRARGVAVPDTDAQAQWVRAFVSGPGPTN